MNNLHFMLDLETMATKRDAAIVSIGAVRFDPYEGTTLDQFYININLASNKRAGREINPDTVEWWLGQDSIAQQALLAEPRENLYTGLDLFLEFMRAHANDEALKRFGRLWSNGPTFDEIIIRHALLEVTALELPIPFRGSRCCRTMIEIAKAFGMKKPAKNTQKHNALSDAIFQAEGVIAAFKELLQ